MKTKQPPSLTERLNCLNPNCAKKQTARGLCSSCYTTAMRLVREGKITWEELEAKGRCLPKTYGAGQPGTAAAWILGQDLEPTNTEN